MTSIMHALESLRDALAAVPDIKTCRIGLEPDISPDDYPMIRLVPVRLRPHTQTLPGAHLAGEAEVLIYLGAPIGAEDAGGLEALYRQQFKTWQAVMDILAYPPAGILDAHAEETITDEDSIDAYKMMAVRARILYPAPIGA